MSEVILDVEEIDAGIAEGLPDAATQLIRPQVGRPAVTLERLREAPRVVDAFRAACLEETECGDQLIVQPDGRSVVAFGRRHAPDAAVVVDVARDLRSHQLHGPLSAECEDEESRARLGVAESCAAGFLLVVEQAGGDSPDRRRRHGGVFLARRLREFDAVARRRLAGVDGAVKLLQQRDAMAELAR